MLGRYGLNCALCDDMGLGKTIQSLTVILNEAAEYK
jgi:SNF2 family DNA or RNA helicase